jgi:hypothetical protein
MTGTEFDAPGGGDAATPAGVPVDAQPGSYTSGLSACEPCRQTTTYVDTTYWIPWIRDVMVVRKPCPHHHDHPPKPDRPPDPAQLAARASPPKTAGIAEEFSTALPTGP